jgi:hypothetical protein
VWYIVCIYVHTCGIMYVYAMLWCGEVLCLCAYTRMCVCGSEREREREGKGALLCLLSQVCIPFS